MPQLAEITNEPIVRDALSIELFLQGLINRGEISASLFGGGQRKFTPVDRLSGERPYVLSVSGMNTRYEYESHSYGGVFSEDGDQTHYHDFSLKRVPKDRVPFEGAITLGELQISVSQDWIAGCGVDYAGDIRGFLSLRGQGDKFLDRICNFARGKE